MHAYTRDTRISGYKECSSCKDKNKSTCIKCGGCYNCHSTEQFSQPPQQEQQSKVIDVYGQVTEPICSYRRCGHNFSEHNTRICKCQHPFNYVIGVSLT
jgi:hypothetical protein